MQSGNDENTALKSLIYNKEITMVIVESYFLAVIMTVITMICWGSWANTQKLATKEWPFQLYYWDYSLGVVILSLIFAFTLGSFGSAGRPFLADLAQAAAMALLLAFIGGAVFNIANILLVAAIDIAGMAVAFPIAIGLALVLGVITNYVATPLGDPVVLFIGVALIVVAIIIDALAYRKLPTTGQKTTAKGIWISIAAGILMGFFYRFVAASMSANFASPEVGKLTPYTAVFIFSLGLFFSNFIWNSIVMAKPFVGDPVPYGDYFKKGNMRLHLIGILGGIIWNIGMSLNMIAAGTAGFAISYGLGQGATMVAAFWGVFIWKEFKGAPEGTNKLLGFMFLFFLLGLVLIIISRIA
jgi:glucose uptake protein